MPEKIPSPTVLIVDDDKNLRSTLRDLLEEDGYQVLEAANGKEALKQVRANSPPLILMDFQLLDRTGIDVVRDIRSLKGETLIIMITGHASLETAVLAIQESVYDFLIKPVDPPHLKRVLGKAYGQWLLTQENRRLIADLKRANDQLTYLNNMKSKFLSMASHDLANSLTTLQTSLEMLLSSFTPTGNQLKLFSYAKNGIEQIGRLIADLVDWASIEQGRFSLQMSSFQLEHLLEEVLPGPLHKIRLKNLQLQQNLPPELPAICADRRRIAQVLTNLLENAIRHTPQGGTIALLACALPQQGQVQVAVKDSGEGIEARDLSKIFESFYQSADAGHARGRLGLGLSIAREIVSGHGGKIWVESQGPGTGSTFYFTLPQQVAAPVKKDIEKQVQ
ncbi:MAG: response regulator [Elusimicrobia bacterium]|nr:response regulator [Elusimicrobiota bacterium]